MTQNYTLCRQALAYYNISADDSLTSEMLTNDAFMEEYDRVCLLDLSKPLPTQAFNTSISLMTSMTEIGTHSSQTIATATARLTASVSSASVTNSASTTTTSSVTQSSEATSTASPSVDASPDGTCGESTGYSCTNSQFGNCCSKYGYCGSTSDYCETNCDPEYGECKPVSNASSLTPTSASAATPTSTANISPNAFMDTVDRPATIAPHNPAIAPMEHALLKSETSERLSTSDPPITGEDPGSSEVYFEEWIDSESLDEQLQQRRRLMERWASASQEFRDSYQARASLPETALEYPLPLLTRIRHSPKHFFCLAPVDRENNASNYARLIKLLILLYVHQNDGAHPMEHEPEPYPQIPALFPDLTRSAPTPEALITQYCLESADFRYLSMTHAGKILFPDFYNNIFIVIDQEALNTGQLIMFELHSNGQINSCTRLRPWHTGPIMMCHNVSGWFLEEMIDPRIHPHYLFKNIPLNLDMPLVDILDTAQQNGELRFTRYTRDDWAAQLEIFAPGYLALERQGLEMNYDLANLWSDLQGYQHWVPPGKYPPGARRREHGQ
ncbi:hypothetical protein AnigIFM56816_003786 [Aspergillus niger]|nr:hypothetical protein AnigIFM56816_003786 [Aspergillus niger]